MKEAKANNCSGCIHIKSARNGHLCRKLGILINDRDMSGVVKCRYYADNSKKRP